MKERIKQSLVRKPWRIIIRAAIGMSEGLLINLISWRLTISGKVDLNELYRTWLSLLFVVIVVLHLLYENLVADIAERSLGSRFTNKMLNRMQPDIQRQLSQTLAADGVQGFVNQLNVLQQAFAPPPTQRQ